MNNPRRCIRSIFAGACTAGMLAAAAFPAAAADVACTVGMRVQGDMGGGQVGTLAEIGSESPHAGWFRIVFGWNGPNGDWYSPSNWVIHPKGSADRCVVDGAAIVADASAAAGAGDSAAATASSSPAALTGTSGSPTASSSVPPTRSTERCEAGRDVVDRQQRRGRVLGENNGMCVVGFDDGSHRSYLAWMLADADAAAADPGGQLPPGVYLCSATGAGSFRIELVDDETYLDRAGDEGEYAVDAASGLIEFDDGSLEGFHAKVLGPGKFGLAAEPTTMFYTVCNRD